MSAHADIRQAVVVHSGGADSTICLHWAMRRFERVQAITFDYGQRHRVEIKCAANICRQLGIPQRVIHLDCLAQLGGNSLTDAGIRIQTAASGSLPNTFVPGRNILFLTLAAAWCHSLQCHDLVTGVCQTDYSGYPDCRAATISSLQQTLTLGMDHPLHIHTPLMHLSKADSIRLAHELGAFESLRLSHTCYEGGIPPCGTCPSCLLRAKGFAEAGFADPLLSP